MQIVIKVGDRAGARIRDLAMSRGLSTSEYMRRSALGLPLAKKLDDVVDVAYRLINAGLVVHYSMPTSLLTVTDDLTGDDMSVHYHNGSFLHGDKILTVDQIVKYIRQTI